MSKSICRTCSYYMPGDPGACNALHVPSIEGEIDCADWKLNEAIAGGLTPDGLHLRERLDQVEMAVPRHRDPGLIVIINTLGILKADFPENLNET